MAGKCGYALDLVAETAYRGWTHDKLLRHPSSKGLREDK
jgi:ATP-dependent DNA ligase